MFNDSFKVNLIVSIQSCKKEKKRKMIKLVLKGVQCSVKSGEFNCSVQLQTGSQSPVHLSESQARVGGG